MIVLKIKIAMFICYTRHSQTSVPSLHFPGTQYNTTAPSTIDRNVREGQRKESIVKWLTYGVSFLWIFITNALCVLSS